MTITQRKFGKFLELSCSQLFHKFIITVKHFEEVERFFGWVTGELLTFEIIELFYQCIHLKTIATAEHSLKQIDVIVRNQNIIAPQHLPKRFLPNDWALFLDQPLKKVVGVDFVAFGVGFDRQKNVSSGHLSRNVSQLSLEERVEVHFFPTEAGLFAVHHNFSVLLNLDSFFFSQTALNEGNDWLRNTFFIELFFYFIHFHYVRGLCTSKLLRSLSQ